MLYQLVVNHRESIWINPYIEEDGCREIGFGVESYNKETVTYLTPSDIDKLIELLKEAKREVTGIK